MTFWAVNRMLAESFLLNCEIFAVTLLLALPLGMLLCFCSRSRFAAVRATAQLYIYLMRATPLMLQLAIVYYLPGFLSGGRFLLPRMGAACLAFVLNYCAYFSEIFRAGLEGIPKGQREAGEVLGLSRRQIFFKVTALQMFKRVLPPLGNEVITLVKDTSLANFIMVKEIIAMAKDFGNRAMIWPLFFTGVYFLVFGGAVTLVLRKLEQRMQYFVV